MGRIVAIDYGQKRVGFATTDELQICAHALHTLPASAAFDFLATYVKQEKVDTIVVGTPSQMNNCPSSACRFIEPFVNRIRKEIPQIPVIRVDERFTSKMALQTMIDAGTSKKMRKNKALVDKISATIILQTYLQQIDIEKNRTLLK